MSIYPGHLTANLEIKLNHFNSIVLYTFSDLSCLKARKERRTGLLFDQLISLFQCLIHAAQLFLGREKPKGHTRPQSYEFT
jgi:hypothetical protein